MRRRRWLRRWKHWLRSRWKLGGTTAALEHNTLVVKTTIHKDLIAEVASDAELAASIADDVREVTYAVLRQRLECI